MRHRSLVRFQPVRLPAPATPYGVPRSSRLSGLAARVEAELRTAELDLHAPDAVVQHDAHQAHRLTTHDRDGPCARQLAEDMHVGRSAWAGSMKKPRRRLGEGARVETLSHPRATALIMKRPAAEADGLCGQTLSAGFLRYTVAWPSATGKGILPAQAPDRRTTASSDWAGRAKSTTKVVA
jgi:hypothetical protein